MPAHAQGPHQLTGTLVKKHLPDLKEFIGSLDLQLCDSLWSSLPLSGHLVPEAGPSITITNGRAG